MQFAAFPGAGISIHALREEGDASASSTSTAPPNFYPRPPRGGRPRQRDQGRGKGRISIHALREEGDFFWTTRPISSQYFYPRPPRGGRLRILNNFNNVELFLSTPSARRATLCRSPSTALLLISIHALREEGDFRAASSTTLKSNFYPRPPRGGRRDESHAGMVWDEFLSTPSARRATSRRVAASDCKGISIHALREEGDQSSARRHHKQTDFYPRPPRGGRPAVGQVLAAQWAISIHALREEGDAVKFDFSGFLGHFYPRPPRGGRPCGLAATRVGVYISIHALREEGDQERGGKAGCKDISIHALREEGDPVRCPAHSR